MDTIATTEDFKEENRIEKLEEANTKIIRKFRKRAEKLGGYESLPQLWEEFAPIILKTIHLKSPIQHLLNFTGDFHDYCDAFKEDTDLYEYKEYFDAMDFAWTCVLKDKEASETDKVRIMNILRDGQDRASLLGLQEVYSHAIDIIEDDNDNHF
ncbi:uncharacterized protein BX663DRAFT_517905 [Cokeromyces recurvatus]|uniref:uncharacterized protein n=1 Tax=Cokeromyces recurvatus TaxID=90255 RepID=UPI0022209329|nr:uncharacterized protein BX663DRAFT_517905 [Cokeromyces recurvatus]KAI7900519.1 hypothetical protein BX663DRAFT_517905 [Cokeromyces recurvatus]